MSGCDCPVPHPRNCDECRADPMFAGSQREAAGLPHSPYMYDHFMLTLDGLVPIPWVLVKTVESAKQALDQSG